MPPRWRSRWLQRRTRRVDKYCKRAVNAAYWGMGMEASITPTRSVDIVGTYKPLESGFNYKQLGVVPKPPSAYK